MSILIRRTAVLSACAVALALSACSPASTELPKPDKPVRHVEGSKLPVMPGAKPFKQAPPPVPALAGSAALSDSAAAASAASQAAAVKK